MNYILLISTIIFLNNISFTQETKKYKGSYDGGTATYYYYENQNYERIYNGDFSYEGNIWIEGWGNTKLIINGKFNNSIKEGLWKYEYLSKEFHKTTSGYYKKGIFDGEWIKKTIKISDKKNYVSEKITFQNGIPQNEYSYSYLTPTTIVRKERVECKGNFDSNGYLHGEWIYKKGSEKSWHEETICRYYHGIQIFELKRNIETGEILEKTEEDTTFIKTLLNTIDKDSISVIDNNYYIVYGKGNRFVSNWFTPLLEDEDATQKKLKIEEVYPDPLISGPSLFSSTHLSVLTWTSIKYNDNSYGIQFKNAHQKLIKYVNSKGEQDLEKNYQLLIKAADSLLISNKIEEAILSFEKAYLIKQSTLLHNHIKKLKKDFKTKNENEEIEILLIQGDEYFQINNFSLALENYEKAQKIKNTDDIEKKIQITRNKISEIRALHYERIKIYDEIKIGYIDQNWNEKVNWAMENIWVKKNSSYGKYYKMCMQYMMDNLEKRNETVNSYLKNKGLEAFSYSNSWEESDNEIMEELKLFFEKMEEIKVFHYSFYGNNLPKEHIKLLKSSTNYQEVIESVIISFEKRNSKK